MRPVISGIHYTSSQELRDIIKISAIRNTWSPWKCLELPEIVWKCRKLLPLIMQLRPSEFSLSIYWPKKPLKIGHFSIETGLKLWRTMLILVKIMRQPKVTFEDLDIHKKNFQDVTPWILTQYSKWYQGWRWSMVFLTLIHEPICFRQIRGDPWWT